MDRCAPLETIRDIVESKFRAYGVDTAGGCSETILVRNSHYCGRRFNCGGWRAVWFVEEGIVKFFDDTGSFRENLALHGDRADRAA